MHGIEVDLEGGVDAALVVLDPHNVEASRHRGADFVELTYAVVPLIEDQLIFGC